MQILRVALIALIGLLLVPIACSGEDTGTFNDDLETSVVEETVEPTSSVLEGVEIVETIPPTAEGDEPEPLNSAGPRRGGVLAAPMSWCPVHDPAVDSSLQFFSLADIPLVTEIHAGLTKISDDANSRFRWNSLIPTTLKTMGSFTNSFSDKASNSVTALR